MSDAQDIPLGRIPGIDHDQVRRLAAHWITSVEQLVGLASTEGGLDSIARVLGVSPAEASALVNEARALLPPDVADELSRPADTSRFGLGAHRPRETGGDA